ncbi:MAG: hypothetical protein ACI9JM_000225 [Halioglobus sp.]|jgi:hypothetical protein
MLRRLTLLLICTVLALLAACRGYDFKVNDKVVYRPAPLFSNFDVTDPALHNCLAQAIIDGDITKATQLDSLNCSNAGIEILAGLDQFISITALKLSSNKIQNLSALAALTSLEVVYLDNNKIADSSALDNMINLRLLDLSGNNTLQCPAERALGEVETLILPAHCR